jgi:putative ABC transport system permease protein
LALSAGGLLVGTLLAIGLARVVESVSFTNSAMGASSKLLGQSANNPLLYLAAAAFLSLVSALAAYLPARRAASIDPMQALRTE